MTDTNAQTEPQVDEFASAFAELANLGEGGAPKSEPAAPAPAAEPAGASAGDGADGADDLAPAGDVDSEEGVGDEGGEGGEGGEGDGAAAPAAQGEGKPAQREAGEDVVGQLADRLRDVLTREPARPETPAQPRQEEPGPAFSAEETELLNGYVNDYPDVARAERLIRQHEYKQLLTHVFKEVAQQLFPVAQQVAMLTQRTHITDLHEMEPDYNNDLRQQVVEWVGTQPAYLRPAYEHVIKQGSPEEIVDLIRRYRSETGAAASQAQSAAAPASAPKTEPELPAAAKQAVAKLAPVGSKRSAVATPQNAVTYEDAFKQAAAMLET